MDDKLALLHPSLGLAFTAEFAPRSDVILGNVAIDNLPPKCPGCREDFWGREICCLDPTNCLGPVTP